MNILSAICHIYGPLQATRWNLVCMRTFQPCMSSLTRYTTTAATCFIIYWSLQTVFKAAKARPDELIQLDQAREEHIDYFSSNRMVGAVGYVDLYAGNLQGLRAKLPALKQLGVTYLHHAAVHLSGKQQRDGGYAVSDFRRVRANLGTMSELAELTAELRADGISVCLDYILNHTSDEHDSGQSGRWRVKKNTKTSFGCSKTVTSPISMSTTVKFS